MKRSLKIEVPFVNGYTLYAALFSILGKNNPWILNNFINIRYAHDWGMYVFSKHNEMLYLSPTLDCCILPRSIIDIRYRGSIVAVIKEAIDLGFYLYLYLNQFYVLDSECYQTYNFAHTTFVYGYDETKKVILVGDNYQNGKYKEIEISYEDIEKAYRSNMNCQIGNAVDNNINNYESFSYISNVHLLKHNENREKVCFVDLAYIKKQMEDYLYSNIENDLQNTQVYDFGINSYEVAIKELKGSEKHRLGKRDFYFWYEHKKLMKYRMDYLQKHSFFKLEKEINMALVELEEAYKNLLWFYLKMTMDNGNLNKEKMINILEVNIKLEKEIFTEILKKIN